MRWVLGSTRGWGGGCQWSQLVDWRLGTFSPTLRPSPGRGAGDGLQSPMSVIWSIAPMWQTSRKPARMGWRASGLRPGVEARKAVLLGKAWELLALPTYSDHMLHASASGCSWTAFGIKWWVHSVSKLASWVLWASQAISGPQRGGYGDLWFTAILGRSTGTNLDLQLASEVGSEPLNCGTRHSRWVHSIRMEVNCRTSGCVRALPPSTHTLGRVLDSYDHGAFPRSNQYRSSQASPITHYLLLDKWDREE